MIIDFDYFSSANSIISNNFRFGLSNTYNPTFPNSLTAKVAPEEFTETINKINRELTKHININLKAFILGLLPSLASIHFI